MDRRKFLALVPMAAAIPVVACSGKKPSYWPRPHVRDLEALNEATQEWFPHNVGSPFPKSPDNLYYSVINTPDNRQYVTYSTGWVREVDSILFLHNWVALPTVREDYAKDWKMYHSGISVTQEELVYGDQTYGGVAGGQYHPRDVLRRPSPTDRYPYPRSIRQLLEKSYRRLEHGVQNELRFW